MKEIIMDSEKGPKHERFFKNAIKLALQDKLSWSTLVSLVNEMTSTLDECKQLIKILIKELQTIQKQKQIERMPEQIPEIVEIEEKETTNDDNETIEELSELAERAPTGPFLLHLPGGHVRWVTFGVHFRGTFGVQFMGKAGLVQGVPKEPL